MAKLFPLTRAKPGPPLRVTTVPPQTNDGTLPLTQRVAMLSIVATWSLVTVTPLFATVGLQTQSDPPPPRTDKQQLIVRTWEPLTWGAQWPKRTPIPDRHDAAAFTRQAERPIPTWPQPDWPTQVTEKVPIPDRHDPAAFTRQAERPIATWPQPDWPTQVTEKVPIPDRHDAPPGRPPSLTVSEQWKTVTVTPLWQTQGLQDGVAPPPTAQPFSRLAASPIFSWPSLDWPTQVTEKVPIPSVVVAGDQPPARVLNYATIDRWFAVTVAPLWGTLNAQNGPASPGDQPPPRSEQLKTIVAQWDPPPLRAVWMSQIIDLSALIPSSDAALMATITSNWIPLDWPRPRRVVATASGPAPQIDNPPPRSRAWMAALAQWDPYVVQVYAASRLVQEPLPDSPPPRSSQQLYLLMTEWWTVSTPLPQRGTVGVKAPAVVFRRTLAQYGTGIGHRQSHGWS